MAEIVNLRRARKAKRRRENAADADASRLLHGRTKAERTLQDAERDRQARRLAGVRRETGSDPEKDET
jgi:acetyl-CoA carboxylase beta subunit